MDKPVPFASQAYFLFLSLLLFARGADFLSTWIAARNFQLAWLMRSHGEENYRNWFVERLDETTPGLFLFCLFSQTLLTAAIGGVLMYWSGFDQEVPLGIGMGIIGYAVAVAVYTLIALCRNRRAARAR